jgi:hypothetical protein
LFFPEKKVGIRISQDESFTASEFQTNVTLRRKGFKIRVLLDQVDGVYVFASIRDSVYGLRRPAPFVTLLILRY